MMAPWARSLIRPHTRSGHQLQEDAERAGLLEDPGVVHDLLRLRGALALEPEAAQRARALRGQPQVADDRDPGPRDAGDAVRHLGATLELDRVAARLGHEPAGVADRRLDAGLVAHVGHVAHDPRVGRAASHGRRVADHVVHRHRQRGVVAEHRHAQAVADEDHVDPGLVLEVGRRVVVAGQPGDRDPLGRLLDQRRQGHALPFGHRGLPSFERVSLGTIVGRGGWVGLGSLGPRWSDRPRPVPR